MRLELLGSLSLHGGAAALAMGFVTLSPPPEPPAAEVVSVSLISTHSFSTNATEITESDALISTISAGGVAVEAIESEIIEPETVKPEITELVKLEPVKAEIAKAEPITPEAVSPEPPPPSEEPTVEPLTEAVEATKAMPLKPQTEMVEPVSGLQVLAAKVINADPQDALAPEPIKLAAIEPLAALPLETTEVVTSDVPVPMPRIANRPDRPQTQNTPVRTKRPPPSAKPRAANKGGNGGSNNADSQASAAKSSAAVSNYPGKIASKLRRALRYPKGTRRTGAAHVQFVVASNGNATSIRVVRSTGDAKLDAAAIATVKRAAPFPSIPTEAGRRSWTFTVPLEFRR